MNLKRTPGPTWLLSLALLPVAAVALPHRGPEIVAHWRFQNGVKGTVATPAHLIADSSGNDQHGVAVGNPAFHRVDLPTGNLALGFGVDAQRIFVPDDAVFELTESLTLEALVRVDRYTESPQRLSYVVFRGDNRPGFDPWFLGVRDTGQLVFQIADELNRSAVVTSPEPAPLEQFVHVAGTLDHATGEMRLYVDGECVASRTTTVRAAGRLGATGPGVGIGNLQTAGNQAFRGLIAEVRISAAALDPDDFLPPPAER